MKAKIKKAVLASLIPNISMSGFLLRGGLAYSITPDGILRGLLLEDSAFDPYKFFVDAFVQPLFIPAEYLILSLGQRLAGGARWQYDPTNLQPLCAQIAEAIEREALPMWTRATSAETVADLIIEHLEEAPDNLYCLEARASCLARAGRFSDSIQVLERLIRVIHAEETKFQWMIATRERASKLRDLLTHDAQQALALLREYELYSREHLKLTAGAPQGTGV